MQNVEIIALAGTTMRGIFAENGSGGTISDVTFRGGKYGLYGGNQQFAAQRLTFIGCDTGVQVIWNWGWVSSPPTFSASWAQQLTVSSTTTDLEVHHHDQRRRRLPPAAGGH